MPGILVIEGSTDVFVVQEATPPVVITPQDGGSFAVVAPSGPPGLQLGVPTYMQETEPTIFPSLWFQTNADGIVIDIRTVTG